MLGVAFHLWLPVLVAVAFESLSHGEHVWIEGEPEVGAEVEIRWDHFIGKGYCWGKAMAMPSGNYLGSVTGNTASTGSMRYQLPTSACKKNVSVQMCCGEPPRRFPETAHAAPIKALD